MSQTSLYFATPIFKDMIKSDLEDFVIDMSKSDKGVQISNRGGWQSKPFFEPEKEFVFEALPPNPAKFLIIPVGPTSAAILSAFAEEFVTALLEEKVSLKVTDKMSPTFFCSSI